MANLVTIMIDRVKFVMGSTLPFLVQVLLFCEAQFL